MTRYSGIHVSNRDLKIMRNLQKNGSSYPKKIADELGLTVWFVFHHLKELEKQKIVRRGERKRNVPYELTEHGEALLWYLRLTKKDERSWI